MSARLERPLDDRLEREHVLAVLRGRNAHIQCGAAGVARPSTSRLARLLVQPVLHGHAQRIELGRGEAVD